MFWDRIAILYDLFETIYNGKVYNKLGVQVATLLKPTDNVLECACGTGNITKYIASNCHSVVATDISLGMIRQAIKNCKIHNNVTFKQESITQIEADNCSFDAVLAGNVIHLLSNPYDAVSEMLRVCKIGGKVIIPTYINLEEKGKTKPLVKLLHILGANFKQQFNIDTYQEFFKKAGYNNVEFFIVEGKMPCAIAVIEKTTPQMSVLR